MVNPTNAPAWVREHLHSGVGDSAAARRRIADRLRRALLGRRIAYTYEVAEYQPEQRLVMRTAQGPFPMETTDTWQPAEGGTRMTLRNQGAPSGFGSVAAPMIAAAMRRANRNDLALLTALLTQNV